jgi:hypothetical protein
MRNAYKILVESPGGKRPLGRPGKKLRSNVRMYLKVIWCEELDCVHVGQGRDQWRALVNMVMNVLFP